MSVRRFAVLSAALASGRRMMILPNDKVVYVPTESTDEQLRERFGVEKIVHAPKVVVWPGIYVDGPLAGRHAYVDVNEVGARSRFWLSEAEGRRSGWYKVTRIAENGRPAELRFLGFEDD